MRTLQVTAAILIGLSLRADRLPGGEDVKRDIRTKVNPKDGLTYVWIPAGTFMMGCSLSDKLCYVWEPAAKEERINSGFWLGKTEVTQKAFMGIMHKNPSRHQGEKFPVEQVNWNDAMAYCEAIGGRLPREAEWEYAARAGVAAPYYGKLEDISWFNINTDDQTKEVSKKKANAFGLHDMLGNVWEWTDDLYGDRGDMRVLRGGAFISGERDMRVSNRAWAEPAAAYRFMGFRCATDESEP